MPIILIKAFDENGFTSDFNLIMGIDFALQHGARVLSLSWSSETQSSFLKNALDYASKKGLIILASAENQPTGKPLFPASYPSVRGVGALDSTGKPWKQSSYGDFVTVYTSRFATFPVGYQGEPGNKAGTSISAAFVANFIAHYLTNNPGAGRNEVLNALINGS